ncbi:MAG: molybdopterin-dependent oxidoreductase [Methanobacteriaceae archaeon]|nr:molybdopterin-dependent oxidoreductase [Methanobacteriaceae archaeon]
MEEILTTCTADCPGTCSIIAQVENGKIVKLRGNPEHEITSGFICKNTRHYLDERFYSRKRILHPLKSEDGNWVQIEWDEALKIAADKIVEISEKYGSQSILYYQGYGARSALRILNRRFFNLLGGVSTLYGSICGGTGQAGMEMDMGVRLSHDPVSHLESDVIIVWGRNPAVTDVHLWRIIVQARRKGAKLVVIDPVKTETTKRADLHLQPTPGSDIYLAMALAKIILKENLTHDGFIENHTEYFEDYLKLLDIYSLKELSRITDISLDELFYLARLYAKGSSSSIILGWGLQRYQKGHLTFRFIDALAAITGNIGKIGGGVSHGFDEYGYFNHGYALDDANNGRKLAFPILGDEILKTDDPPIKLIFITAGNPLAMLANSTKVKKAFESVDYIIMVDQFLNDTADLADLFLPATSFLEDEDLAGSYGHNWISPINPVIRRRGECKSELQIFQELSEKLGFGDEMSGTPREWLEKLARPIINEGISLEELLSKPHRFPSAPITPFSDGKFPTKSGKFEFITGIESEDILAADILERNLLDRNLKSNYDTLRLLSTSPRNWIGSEIPEKEQKKDILEVQVHPKILKRAKIQDGDDAWLESGQSKLLVKVKENQDVRPDYILTYRGGWHKFGKCVNLLTRDLMSDEGNGAPYYETFVKLKRID